MPFIGGVYYLPSGDNPPFPGNQVSTNTLTLIIDDIADALNNIPPIAGSAIKVGTTQVQNGTNGYFLYDNSGILGNEQSIPVTNGGTGLGSLTPHGILLGEGSSTPNFAVLGDAQLLIGQTSADPLAKTISGDGTLADTGVLTVTKTNGVPFRTPLTTATTFYISTTGNDSSGNGSSGNPWLTPQHAYNVLSSLYDFGGQAVTVQFADGTYNITGGALNMTGPWTGGGTLTFQGDLATPDNVVINVSGTGTIAFLNSCILPGAVTLEGMKITGATDCIRNANSGVINFQSIDFGSVSGHHIAAVVGGAEVSAIGSYTISGGAQFHIFGNNGGFIRVLGTTLTVTLTGTPAFSGAYAGVQSNAIINGNGPTYSGSATGPRYSAILNGTIFTNGAGPNFFPGSTAGSTSSGGQYA
jgi:hypothetical protein